MSGNVQSTLLLWHVWSGKGVIAQAVLQQGWPYIISLCNFSFLELNYLSIWISNFWWQDVRGCAQVPESDVVQACRRVSPLASYYLFLVCTKLLFNKVMQRKRRWAIIWSEWFFLLFLSVAWGEAEFKCLAVTWSN